MTDNESINSAYPQLSRIHSPEDLKNLELPALTELATEIRRIIAETCSRNGGHFAPSLGVVELTIALHSIYDAPKDRIVWDVGHQAYPHKLLTGRLERFHTMRQLDGLSGFPRREESPYDAFGVGHASTAISAALGMALARDQRGDKHRVVAICGDGAMTGGLCYEALNNVGYRRPDMLIVLNDNEMSISPNIGAMARYFNQIITNELYNRSKETAEDLIKRVPAFGQRVVDFSHRVERSIKNLIVPEEETIFEKMGIRYIGPVDGHDLEALLYILEHIKDLKGPMLLHLKTTKGKGYPYSENDPERWHSGAHFSIDTGEKVEPPDGFPTVKVPTYTEVFSKTLVGLAQSDSRITAITAAMPTGTGLSHFSDHYPARFHDVGIAEEHAVCCAAGMACEGLRPVVAIYSSFLQRGFDQIIHDVALQKLPVTFAIDRAGIVGDDGPTHHGVFDLSYLRMIPNMVVAAPRNERELQRIMATAAAYEDGPFAYRYPRGRAEGLPLAEKPEPVAIGKGEVLREAPDDANGARVAILSVGTMAGAALEAADLLYDSGVGVGVFDMRFVKPLDREMLEKAAREYDLLVTVEENVLAGGFGAAVNETLGEMGIEKTPLNIGLPDAWIEQGSIKVLKNRYGLDADGIAEKVRERLRAHHDSETRSEAPIIAK